MEHIYIILTSSVVAALISAFVAIRNNQLKISIKNITRERAKWRNAVRKKALEVHNAIINKDKETLQKLRVEFFLILNPLDNEDNLIIESIKIPESKIDEELKAQSDEFAKHIALLLKHDWERAKLEAGSTFCRLKFVNKLCKCLLYKPKREKINL